MSFSRPENFKIPDFCANCPALEGMESLEIRRTLNHGPSINTWYREDRMPADPIIYAHDPENLEAGAVALGKDHPHDPFCQIHENAVSQSLGHAHEKVETCPGPITETKKGWFGREKEMPAKCGAGFRNIGELVMKLNEGHQDYPSLYVYVDKTARTVDL